MTEFDVKSAILRLEARIERQEERHDNLDTFAKQMHSDQRNLAERLDRIWTILNQIRWIAFGAVIFWMISHYGPESLTKIMF